LTVVLGYILADFFTNSSGQPEHCTYKYRGDFELILYYLDTPVQTFSKAKVISNKFGRIFWPKQCDQTLCEKIAKFCQKIAQNGALRIFARRNCLELDLV
jgi:hypothetical protein